MKLLEGLLVTCLLLPSFEAEAQEHGRVKWKRPTQAETDHMASESAITDIILRKGDIVVTDRGFFMFRGFLADGRTGDFIPVPNHIKTRKRETSANGFPMIHNSQVPSRNRGRKRRCPRTPSVLQGAGAADDCTVRLRYTRS